MSATIHLNQGTTHRILQGHPWVFRSEIGRVEGSPQDGGTVQIRSGKRLLGSGIYNSRSQITVRRYSRGAEALDRAFLAGRIRRALEYRSRLAGTAPDAQRLVWSESDELPGLIVDRYGDILVVQALTLAMAQAEETIAEILEEMLRPRAILARNDAPVRKLEGLPLEKKILRGAYEGPTPVKVQGLSFHLDLWEGQKTGFYLDQADNYAVVSAHARGKRVLDCFTNQGAFALAAMQAGAASCRALDQSGPALALGKETAQRHGLPVEWVEGNVFDLLREYEKEKRLYDLVILDPPSFTKTKAQQAQALRGYHELHVRALRLLPPGGMLATFCCSHHVGEEQWRDLLVRAAADSGRLLRLVRRMTQSADHPVLPAVPETEYLKGYLLEKAD
jgi:23S rRNA (cytosine1962-C5)-methyltransferase